MTSRSRGAWLGILAGLVLAAGCVPETSPLLREDFDRLRADLLRSQQALQKGQSDLRAEIQQGDQRTLQTLSDVQKSVARLEGRVDTLARDTGQIQGRLDELRKRVDLLALQLDVGALPGAAPTGSPGSSPSGRSGPGAGSGGAAGALPGAWGQPAGPGGPAPGIPGVSAAPGGELTGGSAGSSVAAAGLTTGGGSPPWSPPPPAAAPAAATLAQRPPAPGAQSTDLYQIAYIDYTKGNYTLAIAGFREFLRLSPTSELAEKAQYWIAESHFSQGRLFQTRGEKERSLKEFEQAVEAFRRVYLDHPRGDRVPAAAYKEALARLELGQQELAVGRLQWLMDYYPNTEEAAKAREDLARIKKR